MSVKTETIEVRLCDFCSAREQVRTCDHCYKDVCGFCQGANLALIQKRWAGGIQFDPAMLGNTLPDLMDAVLCGPCKGEIFELLAAFGFNGIAVSVAKQQTA